MPQPTQTVTWTAAHDRAVLNSLVSLVLANRREIYKNPILADVSGNGGSRINQRILLMMRKMCKDFGEKGLVDELIRSQPSTGRRKRKSDEEEGDVKGEVKREVKPKVSPQPVHDAVL